MTISQKATKLNEDEDPQSWMKLEEDDFAVEVWNIDFVLTLDLVVAMPQLLLDESTSPGHKDIVENGVSKLRFDGIADTVEAFSMTCLLYSPPEL